MNDKFTLNNVENNESYMNNEECDYKDLILRLRDISSTIALLEKHYLDKF